MSFINPVKNSEIKKNLLSKTVKILSTKNDDVFCPYNSTVVEYNPNECGGKLKLKHDIKNNTVYSVFCNIIGVPNSIQYPKTYVSKNTKIGEINGDKLEYFIEDYYGRKLDVFDYIKKEVKCKSNEVFNELTNKCETKKTSSSTDGENYSNDINADPITSLLLKGMMSPFGVVSNMMDPKKRKEEKEKRQKEKEEKKKKEEEENDKQNKLTEEINRIKKLLK